MAKLSPNAKGVERVDAATGSRFIEELDLAVNRTTKEVNKSYEIYLSLYQAVATAPQAAVKQCARDPVVHTGR